jgi:glycine betaine/proline transport system ATP-binding protein
MKDGAFVQVGTPEEVVSAPADDYVADFIRDVPRAHVLTARTIMAPAPAGDGREYGGDVAATTVVQELLPMVVNTDLPLRVVDGSQMVGVVDRTAVMTALLEDR